MKYLKTLLKLKQNRELNYSSVPKVLLEELLSEGLVEVVGLRRKKVVVNQYFDEFYKDIKPIDKATTRSDLAKLKDTKLKKISPQDGLYLNGRCQIGSTCLPIAQDSALFIKEMPIIAKETLVVVVENFENLLYCNTTLKLFREEDILFVYRNNKARELISVVENEIVYFGDFDLAGVAIYLNEILPRNPSIKLFIPYNIEQLLYENGSSKLYQKHFSKYKELQTDIKEVQHLLNTIHKTQKSLEQEYFIDEVEY